MRDRVVCSIAWDITGQGLAALTRYIDQATVAGEGLREMGAFGCAAVNTSICIFTSTDIFTAIVPGLALIVDVAIVNTHTASSEHGGVEGSWLPSCTGEAVMCSDGEDVQCIR